MRILHVCLASSFVDNYAYQENMLPKYQKEAGHDVAIIASLFTFDKNGKGTYLKEGTTYKNEYDIEVTRLNFKKNSKFSRKMRCYKNTYTTIEKYAPDIIFIHNVQFHDIKEIVRYLKKHPNVKVFADNHADFINSASNFLSKNILHKIIWRHCAKLIEPYTSKFYGVLPARVDFLKNIYNLPQEKVELLVMGADDEKVEETKRDNKRVEIRNKYGIKDEDFLIITGGKIDRNKPETLELMKAASMVEGIKLMVFGSVIPELRDEFDKLCENDNIIYVGWINSTDVYQYYDASELAFFPGKHSVLWEQAVGMGLPCVFRKMEGFTHVDIGGNCVLIEDVSFDSLKKCIEEVYKDKEAYNQMKKIAEEKGIKEFSYREIAKRSIM